MWRVGRLRVKLDEKGRCCGRKPIHYKGGSWCSPPDSPMYFCHRCDREYAPDGQQRENWAWKMTSDGTFEDQRRHRDAKTNPTQKD